MNEVHAVKTPRQLASSTIRRHGWLSETKRLKLIRAKAEHGCIFEKFRIAEAGYVPALLLYDHPRDDLLSLTEPVEVVVAEYLEDVEPALERVQALADQGLMVCGFLSDEASQAFDRFSFQQRELEGFKQRKSKLSFGAFDRATRGSVRSCPPSSPALEIEPTTDRTSYMASVEAVLAKISAGEIYQANFTFPTRLTVEDAFNQYLDVRLRPRAPSAALFIHERHCFQSFLPELFFSINERSISGRPMKGTRGRSPDSMEDRLLRGEHDGQRFACCQRGDKSFGSSYAGRCRYWSSLYWLRYRCRQHSCGRVQGCLAKARFLGSLAGSDNSDTKSFPGPGVE